MADLYAVKQSLQVAEITMRNQDAAQPVCVLLVEDEVFVRMAMAEDLREHGYDVIEAAGGEEALGVLRSGTRIDAVVTDMRMPGALDGRGLVRSIRDEFPGLRVIMVSAELPEADVLRLLDGFFPKPVTTHEISAVLQAFHPGA